MKRVVPDLSVVLNYKFLSQRKVINDFKNLWGTTYVDGVEVFVERRYFYPSMDSNLKKLAKILGIYESLKQKQQGVASSWLYFNRGADDRDISPAEITQLANNLILAIPNRTKKVKNPETESYEDADDSYWGGTITIGPKFNKQIKGGWDISDQISLTADIVSDFSGAVSEIMLSFKTMWDDNRTIVVSEDDPYKTLLMLYALHSTSPLESEIVALRYYNDKTYSTTAAKGVIQGTPKATTPFVNLAVSVKVKKPTFVQAYALAETILTSEKRNGNITDKQVQRIISEYFLKSSKELDPDWPDYSGYSAPDNTDWVKGAPSDIRLGYGYYLKVSAIDDGTNLGLEQRIKYLYSLLDSDYKEKKKKWYEEALGFIIIITAVAIAGPAGGAAFAAVGGGIWGVVAAVAITLSIAAVYIQVAAVIASVIGGEAVASVMANALKKQDKLIKIANVVSIIVGIQIALKAALEKAGATLADASLKEIGKALLDMALSNLTGYSVNNTAMVNAAHLTNFAIGEYGKYENRRHQKWISDKYEEIQKLREATEQSAVSDTLKDFARIQPMVLSMDNSVYAARYDKPYEPWSTAFHSGNIQANSVQAWWQSTEQDDNI